MLTQAETLEKYRMLMHVSEQPWSNYTAADYTVEQWHRACLIHQHQGAPTSKSECKVPVRTPDGALNRNGVHAAAAALAGARGGVNASPEQLSSAKAALRRLYSELGEESPDSLKHEDVKDEIPETQVEPLNDVTQPNLGDAVEEFLSHYGVKGMKWGTRKSTPGLLPGASTSMRVGRAVGNRVNRRRTAKSTPSEPTHTDFARATDIHSRAKAHGTRVLSNQEMRDVIARMELEQKYSNLNVGQGKAGSSKVKREGSKFVSGILKNVGQQVASEVLKGHAMSYVVKSGLTAKKP